MRPYNLYKERRLLLLHLALGGAGGGSGISEMIVTGISPLTLVNAVAAELVSLTRKGKCILEPKEYVDTLTQYGKLIQNGTPTPDAPVWPSINNGTVRMVWRGDGIAEGDGSWRRAYINTTSSTWNYYEDASSGIRIPIQSGQYRLHWDKTDTSVVGTIFRVGFVKTDTMPSTGAPVQLYKADGTTGLEVASSPQNAQTVELEVSGTGINYIVIQVSGSNSAWSSGDFGELWERISHLHLQTRQLSVDGTPEVLTVGTQTATVPDLYAVGDYKDEAEIISGGVTRNVGMKVLDGTENWTLNGTMRYFLTIPDMATLSGRTEGLCTHFRYAGSSANNGTYFLTSAKRMFVHTDFETDADFKAYLAAQYAAGTPVIVWYPLAEETTEQVDPQHLTIVDSDVILIDSVIDGIETAKTKSIHTVPTPYQPLNILYNNGVITKDGTVGTKEILTVTPYGSTASVEDLLGVGDYADTHEIVSGAVNRKVGVKVFDGTENWMYVSENKRMQLTLDTLINDKNAPLLISHGTYALNATIGDGHWRVIVGGSLVCYSEFTSAADFKAYLADQYAKGTPVIVLYPLAEETTETVVYQEIDLVDGTNTITSSSAISDVEMTAVYSGKAD